MINQPKMIELYNTDFKIDLKNVFYNIDKSALLRKRLEEVRNMFKKKYSMESLQVYANDESKNYLISSLDNNKWHDYLWSSFLMGHSNNALKDPYTLKRLTKFINGETFVDYASVRDASGAKISAYILGIKLNGYAFSFWNPITKNKIYLVACFHNISIEDMSYNTYASLVRDLEKVQDMLDVYLEYFKLTGTIDDSYTLEMMLQKDKIYKDIL